jgi:hypothetical protein
VPKSLHFCRHSNNTVPYSSKKLHNCRNSLGNLLMVHRITQKKEIFHLFLFFDD